MGAKQSKRVKEVKAVGFRAQDEKRNVKEAKGILKNELKGETIVIERGFKEKGNRGKGKISAHEKAAMMRTVIEKPDITGAEFGKKHGYALRENGLPSGAASRMLGSLREELKGYEIPEMEDILKADLLAIALVGREQLRRLKDEPDTVSFSDLEGKFDRAFKRIRLLRGESTSNSEIKISKIETMNEQDLDAFLNDAITVEVKD